MSSQIMESVQVTIFNQVFSLRSHSGGGEHIREVARQVDERMRHISSHLTTHDVAKVAILAALNFADELQRVRDVQTEASEVAEDARAPETGGSWFDDIFDSSEPAREKGNRLSSQVSARLHGHRRSKSEAPAEGEGKEEQRPDSSQGGGYSRENE